MNRPVQALVRRSALGEDDGDAPVVPDYGGACLTEVVPSLYRLLDRSSQDDPPSWFAAPLREATQVVLLVLDGLGWDQLVLHRAETPALASMAGGPITSVVPSTTATALSSIVTGRPPAEHGVLGYRIAVGGDVLNVLKWTTPTGDARKAIPPSSIQLSVPFLGKAPPVVSRSEFAGSGFTEAHLAGLALDGWRMPSAIAVEVGRLARQGAPLIYAYYDGIDKTAHDKGLGEHFIAELRSVDHIVEDVLAALPSGVALLVTADHGQVEVQKPAIVLDEEVMRTVTMLSGEGRFRWLHAREGAVDDLLESAVAHYGDIAWVHTRDELVGAGWFGGPLSDTLSARLGDVALVAREPVAFADPQDTGELRLVSRHGSLTAPEMFVPYIVATR